MIVDVIALLCTIAAPQKNLYYPMNGFTQTWHTLKLGTPEHRTKEHGTLVEQQNTDRTIGITPNSGTEK